MRFFAGGMAARGSDWLFWTERRHKQARTSLAARPASRPRPSCTLGLGIRGYCISTMAYMNLRYTSDSLGAFTAPHALYVRSLPLVSLEASHFSLRQIMCQIHSPRPVLAPWLAPRTGAVWSLAPSAAHVHRGWRSLAPLQPLPSCPTLAVLACAHQA